MHRRLRVRVPCSLKKRLYHFNFVRVSYRSVCVGRARASVAHGFYFIFWPVQKVLMQLEKEARQAKLEETLQSVYKIYERIMALLRQ